MLKTVVLVSLAVVCAGCSGCQKELQFIKTEAADPAVMAEVQTIESSAVKIVEAGITAL